MHNVYFFTDIHGCKDFYDAIMSYINKVDSESTIIFGGDACDRGEHGYEIILQLLDNPYVVYLKGNHEDMFVNAARELHNSTKFKNADIANMDDEELKKLLHSLFIFSDIGDVSLHLYNHGFHTLKDWIRHGANMAIIDRLDKLPLVFSYENIDFFHSGGGSYNNFLNISNYKYNHIEPQQYEKNTILWARGGVNLNWQKNRICVHGHTPVSTLQFFKRPENEVVPAKYNGRYAITEDSGYKLNMDTGVAFTNRAFLYNCLEDKIIGFYKNDKTEEITIHENIKPFIRGEKQ